MSYLLINLFHQRIPGTTTNDASPDDVLDFLGLIPSVRVRDTFRIGLQPFCYRCELRGFLVSYHPPWPIPRKTSVNSLLTICLSLQMNEDTFPNRNSNTHEVRLICSRFHTHSLIIFFHLPSLCLFVLINQRRMGNTFNHSLELGSPPTPRQPFFFFSSSPPVSFDLNITFSCAKRSSRVIVFFFF